MIRVPLPRDTVLGWMGTEMQRAYFYRKPPKGCVQCDWDLSQELLDAMCKAHPIATTIWHTGGWFLNRWFVLVGQWWWIPSVLTAIVWLARHLTVKVGWQ